MSWERSLSRNVPKLTIPLQTSNTDFEIKIQRVLPNTNCICCYDREEDSLLPRLSNMYLAHIRPSLAHRSQC